MMITIEDIIKISHSHARKIAYLWPDTCVEADDLQQEGALHGWMLMSRIDASRTDRELYSYLHKSIDGHMRDVMRKMTLHRSQSGNIDKRHMELEGDQEDGTYLIDNDTPDAICFAKQIISHLMDAPRSRDYAMLEMLSNGHSHRDIAEALRITESRVSQVVNGRILRRFLKRFM